MKKKARVILILGLIFCTIFQNIYTPKINAVVKNPIIGPSKDKDYKEIAKTEIEKIYGLRSKAFTSLDLKKSCSTFRHL
ncbi:hypothetical protein [Clostridium sp. DMHC 10]|uniref:hypothetical protein n=1 Tax=Clostridium sp. DMHC 10 TaxID=747377 RepID=UPI00069CD7ED|nr:hypothetical protein [Clostridium sp. DMHC 10]